MVDQPDVVAYASNPIAQDAEPGGLGVRGQPGKNRGRGKMGW